MEDVIRTRLRLIHESLLTYINSARSACSRIMDNDFNFNELELSESKLKGAVDRFVMEIHNYCKYFIEPNSEEISQYTATQIQAQDLIAELNVHLKSRYRTQVPQSDVHGNIVSKLPRMELAKFDGNVLKWYQFWDQFSSNVGNRNISDVDKLLYLQSALEGDAKQAIEGLDTTNKNYQIAVKTLKERYGKPNVIIDAHYVALYRIKSANKTVKECRQVLNEIERHLRVLGSLGEDVNHNHLRVMIIEKFPEDLIYELRLKMTDKNESIDDIRKYLEYIISARETSNRLTRDKESPYIKGSNNENMLHSEQSTLGSLHVRTEENRNNNKSRFMSRNREGNRVGHKFNDKFKSLSRKRPRGTVNQTDEPPTKKFIRRCIFCKQDHFSEDCANFKTIWDRKSCLRNRCYNCFGRGHKLNDCFSRRPCIHCKKSGLHHRALCPNRSDPLIKSSRTDSLHISTAVSTTLLQTSLVKVSDLSYQTKEKTCRLLLDSGSQRSYITSSIATYLNLPTVEKVDLSIFTFGTKSPQYIKSRVVNFMIKTRIGIKRSIYANVVPHITNSVQAPVFNNLATLLQDSRLKGLILADDGSYGDKIDILIGNDYYHTFISNEKLCICDNLFLVNSDFGWVWSGRVNEISPIDQLSVLTYFQSAGTCDSKLHEPDLPLKTDEVIRLWDLESIGIVDSPKCSRDEEAIKQFNKTIQYNGNRYYVKWPWIEYPPDLPDNLGLAYGRLNNLMKRLDNLTINAYDKVIKEQLQNGVVEIVKDASFPLSHPVHYLPHHCVFNRDKPDKLRIVYDASAKIAGNQSLNECLYKGPLMLEDLTALLIKFREHAIGITADVEKAFLQLGLQGPDKDVTRFLWLKNINDPINKENILTLRFCRVPFGVISSPFLLNATIKYHLMKCNNSVLKQIAHDLYVDNIVTGAQTVLEAENLYKTSKLAFNDLAMNLREWNSNSKNFLSRIPVKFCTNNEIVKVLGLIWNTKDDKLLLKYDISQVDLDAICTKRGILRMIASVYDPCGYAIPILLRAKLFFQKLWKQKISWDTKINSDLLSEWRQIIVKLNYIKHISIDRYYLRGLGDKRVSEQMRHELHCFTDASMEAYAACVYLRSSLGTSNIVTFIIGKSRLVPIKEHVKLQIPKLELLGALIGSRLLKFVNKNVRLSINAQILWTDSQVVISWYHSRKLLLPFVSRRINEIKQNMTLTVKYIPSQYNPADIGTRSDRIDDYNRWLKGPDFLLNNLKNWFSTPGNYEYQVDTQIASVGEGLTNENKSSKDTSVGNEININNSDGTNSSEPDKDLISKGDKDLEIISKLQATYFPEECNGVITDFSRSLGLYKDNNGILRCKGRFKHTDWTHYHKEPILLPKNSEFTHKIIADLHEKNYHVGVSHTLALLRNRFWVPQGRSIVQKILRKCQSCLKYGGGPFKLPAMPDLPSERVKFNSPFASTGMDYFGPLYIINDSKEKCWVCLFTCLTIRAVHMEVIRDLSADECLLAIRRFVAVRGLPQLIISDNAMHFKLASEVLLSDYCILNKITWKFIPELAPWFGGFYERLIALVKHCLKRTIDKHLLNSNQLCTVIKEIEAIVNTRPLTPVGAELEYVLTPTDFLRIGGTTTTEISDRDLLEPASNTKSNLIDSWKRGQIIIKEFVKMFSNQYLCSLRERSNRHKQPRVVVDRIPRVGEIVQIKAEGSRVNWKVGKIKELIKGSDGHIRVAKISTMQGDTLTRSISHLYPLEVEDNMNTVPVPESDSIRQLESTSEIKRSRESAIKARERIKNWTSQLMLILFEEL